MFDTEVAILDEDGRLVMPSSILEGMDLDIFANFEVTREGDTLTLSVIRPADRKLALSRALKETEGLEKMSEEEVAAEILEYKKEQRRQKT